MTASFPLLFWGLASSSEVALPRKCSQVSFDQPPPLIPSRTRGLNQEQGAGGRVLLWDLVRTQLFINVPVSPPQGKQIFVVGVGLGEVVEGAGGGENLSSLSYCFLRNPLL